VKRFHWVVEIGEIDRGIGLRGWLVLRLRYEYLVFLFGKILSFGCVEVCVHTVHLGGGAKRTESRSTLDSQLNFVILQRDQWERFGPVFTEKEWNHVIITGGTTDTLRVIGNFGRGDGTRSFRLTVLEQNVVDTLYVKGIHAAHFLSADVEAKFGDGRIIGGMESIRVDTDIRYIWLFYPHIAQKITL